MNEYYRVCHIDTKQGLWYSAQGTFTGLIHDQFDFCVNTSLRMDYDPEIVGYMSAVESLEKLFGWFTREDILKLQEHNFFIHKYLSDDVMFYERFQHPVINSHTAILVDTILLKESSIVTS